MELRIVIVDGVASSRARLKALLLVEPRVRVVAALDRPAGLESTIGALAPDAVFIDSGSIPEEPLPNSTKVRGAPELVVTSDVERHAHRAFELGAIDYLLKPFVAARVAETLRRIRERRTTAARPTIAADAQRAAETGRSASPRSRWNAHPLMVKHGGRAILLDPSRIDWLEADGKYVKVHAGRQVYSVRDTLNRLEAALDPTRFVRVHRSRMVRLDMVRMLRPRRRGDYEVVLKGGASLHVGRGYVTQLLAHMDHAI